MQRLVDFFSIAFWSSSAEKKTREGSLLLEVGKQLRASDEKLSAARAAAEKAKAILAEERTTLLQARHSPTSCGAARFVFSRCSATKKNIETKTSDKMFHTLRVPVRLMRRIEPRRRRKPTRRRQPIEYASFAKLDRVAYARR